MSDVVPTSLLLGLLASLVLGLLGCAGPGVRRHELVAMELQTGCARRPTRIPPLVYLPPGYADPQRRHERWPLVLHLHGILAEGSSPSFVTRDGLPRCLEQGFSPPCIVVSPQLWTLAQRWDRALVAEVLDEVLSRYRVDPDRVVLLGVSAGASTGWDVVKAMPERFAAFVPVAGWTTAGGVERARDVPVWAVYGVLDFTAPAFLAARGVRVHRGVGGTTRLSVVPWVSHWIPRRVWQWPELWAWILAQRRPAHAPGVVRKIGE